MPIYDKPVRFLMKGFADTLHAGQPFGYDAAVKWFAEHYPKVNPGTVRAHVDGMSANSKQRKHHPSIKPGLGWDLFFKIGRGQYRLYDPATDPEPYYPGDPLSQASGPPEIENEEEEEDQEEQSQNVGSREFVLESHLRDYLERNLGMIELGLAVYEEEGLRGVEYPVGGRRIDILAIDAKRNFVVIELKVSRGYDRTVGQLLRYMGWVEKNMSNGHQVRGVIVASKITEDLKLAASRLKDVKLVEYEIDFRLRPVT